MSKLEKFIKSLDEDYGKVVSKWETRQRVLNVAMCVLGALFIGGVYYWVNEAALGVSSRGEPWVFALILVIGGTSVAILYELGAERYGWSRTLVDAGRCVAYETLLHTMNQHNRPHKARPLFVADYELLQEQADAMLDRKVFPSERAAAVRLGQIG